MACTPSSPPQLDAQVRSLREGEGVAADAAERELAVQLAARVCAAVDEQIEVSERLLGLVDHPDDATGRIHDAAGIR